MCGERGEVVFLVLEIDDSRDHVINSGENSKVIFEIINEGEHTAYNVVPETR